MDVTYHEYILERIKQLKADSHNVILFPLEKRANEKENPTRRRRRNRIILDTNEGLV